MFGDVAWFRESDADTATPVEFDAPRTAAETADESQAAQ